MPNYEGQRVDQSHSEGRTIRRVWADLFAENERAWRRGPGTELPLTDAELAAAVQACFPTRNSGCLSNVRRARRDFNRGAWGERPVHRCYAYSASSDDVLQLSARGRILQKRSEIQTKPLQSK